MTPAPGAAGSVIEAEQQLRRLVCLAATVWLLVWTVAGVSALDRTALPALYVAAMLVWLAGSVLAVRPLLANLLPTAPERRDAWVVAVTLPLAGLVDLVAAGGGSLDRAATWIAPGSLVPLVALVLRGHGRLAAGAVVALLVAQGAAITSLDPEVPQTDLVVRATLAPLWVAGALVVRGYLRHTRDRALELRARRAAAATERLVAERWSALRARRQADLEDEVLPLLHRVCALGPGEPVAWVDRDLASSLASSLRDSLLARTLMTADLRRRVTVARRRGMRVALHNALDDGPAVTAVRDLVGRLLDLPGAESLSVRTFDDPREATLVLRFADPVVGPSGDAVAAAVGGGVEGWAAAGVHDLDGVVVVELAGRAGPSDGTVG